MKQLDNWVHRSIGPNPLATSKERDAGTPGGGGDASDLARESDETRADSSRDSAIGFLKTF